MDLYWIWFSRVNKIGARTQNALLKKYKFPKVIWSLTKEQLEKSDILTKDDVEIIMDKKYRCNLEKYEYYMKNNDIKFITIENDAYPKMLRNIYDPPIALFIKGNEKILDNKSIAIVGSRKCSDYGKKISERFAYNLSKNKINIVSGLANGIDKYAHIGAIKARENTVAVLGSGIDIIYPYENREIARKIIANGGAIISEYVPGTKPEKTNFPARNRIISGLSEGVLVVEAREKSGSFITVDFALEQGKNVYSIPGNIDNTTSKRNE